MKKISNIKHTLQIIRNLPLPIAYPQIEKWVIEYEEKPIKTQRVKKLKPWLLIKYRLFTWWKK